MIKTQPLSTDDLLITDSKLDTVVEKVGFPAIKANITDTVSLLMGDADDKASL